MSRESSPHVRDHISYTEEWNCDMSVGPTLKKGKASSLDIAPLTLLNSGALQPWKWRLTGNDCSTAAHAVAAQSPR